MRLVIVSHVPHYLRGDEIVAYGPYAREIDVWADLFTEVIVAAPRGKGDPPADCIAMTRPNVELAPQWDTGGTTAASKIMQVLSVPILVYGLVRTMRRGDAIHVRCPGNLGLLGAALAPLFSPRIVAKYAGQWTGYPDEPWSYRVQRSLLRSRWWRGPVTVYEAVTGQPAKVVPFFTSILSDAQLARTRRAARTRTLGTPMRILYAGRLSTAKNVDVLLTAEAGLEERGVSFTCEIAGDGPERARLEAMAADLGLSNRVAFLGALDLDRMLDVYERADVLVLASRSEGWPKAIAEAMAFGVVCVGSDRGLIPEMLGEGRGIVVPPGDPDALADALAELARHSDRYSSMSRKSAEWGRRYSLESLRDGLRELLEERWSVKLISSVRSDRAEG